MPYFEKTNPEQLRKTVLGAVIMLSAVILMINVGRYEINVMQEIATSKWQYSINTYIFGVLAFITMIIIAVIRQLKTSGKHRLKVNGQWKHVNDINVGELVETEFGTTKLISKKEGDEEILYDISVDEVHCYYSNGVLSHNSWVLAKLGVEAMKQGKNVVHFTLELNENYVGLRYDACFTGIDFQNIRNNVDIVKQKIAEVPGKLKIKYFPIKTVSAYSLKSHCERLAVLGTKVDLIIVDYADILRPSQSERNSNSYSDSNYCIMIVIIFILIVIVIIIIIYFTMIKSCL